MRMAGYQPQYFPRLHYFNRILTSDIFEISDYVQFVAKHAFPKEGGGMKRGKSFQAHTPIKLATGTFLLAIPVHDKLLPINKTEIDYSNDWVGKHLKSMEVGYRKSKNFAKFFPELESLLTPKYENLGELTIKTTLWGIARLITDDYIDALKINIDLLNEILNAKGNHYRLKKIFLASESTVSPPEKGETNKWLIDLCKYAGADEYYYGGTSHAAYMDDKALIRSGINPVLQNWNCCPYTQQYSGIGFFPNLSVIDLVMNEEPEGRMRILN